MGIPKYNEFMLPVLKLVKDKDEISMKKVVENMGKEFNLTEQELKEKYDNNERKTVFYDRVHWARTYLKKAKLLKSPKRGYVQITDRGQEVLNSGITEIDRKYLLQFPAFKKFTTIKTDKEDSKETQTLDEISEGTPIETIESAVGEINEGLKEELLENILKASPAFFEGLVIDLLINLGYGGSKKEAGRAFKTTRDGGVDGIIKEDNLGLDVIYTQAKRFKDQTVSEPQIRDFVGALEGKKAKKGIFITTSTFTKSAKDYIKGIGKKIVFIDRDKLLKLMVETGTGLNDEETYTIKKINTDYFEEE